MSKKNKRKKRKRKIKKRNHLALLASMKSGSGLHKDQKKEADKKKCREEIKDEE